MMYSHYMHGVEDYDWSKWGMTEKGTIDPNVPALTEDEKKAAAAIVDTFKSAADFEKWMQTDTKAPMRLRFIVQYASTVKKAPIKDLTYITSFATPEAKKEEKKEEEKKETPVLLYAIGAAVLFALLRK